MTEIRITTGDLGAEAAPLRPRRDPLRTEIKDMVLPPAALVDQLDNSGPAPSGEARPQATSEETEELAELDFVGNDLPERTFTLRYPFRFEGRRYDAVTVRQLTTGEVGRLSADWARSGKPPQLYDVYAVMTGLPARVLRRLPASDGEPIVDAAYDFLPPSFRPAAG